MFLSTVTPELAVRLGFLRREDHVSASFAPPVSSVFLTPFEHAFSLVVGWIFIAAQRAQVGFWAGHGVKEGEGAA
jgi:hypothetical protein